MFLIGWASIDARGTPLHPSSGPLGLSANADDETSSTGPAETIDDDATEDNAGPTGSGGAPERRYP